jgi:hypothetical protein
VRSDFPDPAVPVMNIAFTVTKGAWAGVYLLYTIKLTQ